jgi:hypothetical protein
MLIANILELRADPNNFLEGYLKLLHSPFNPTVYSAGSIFFLLAMLLRNILLTSSFNLRLKFAGQGNSSSGASFLFPDIAYLLP